MLRKTLFLLTLSSTAFAQSITWGGSGSTTTAGSDYGVQASGSGLDNNNPYVTLKKNGNVVATTAYSAGYTGWESATGTVNFDANAFAPGNASIVAPTYHVTVGVGSMTVPTSLNYTISSHQTWAPAVTCSDRNGSGSGAYCISGITGWNTVGQSITSCPAGSYSLYVAQIADSSHNGNVTDPGTGIRYEMNSSPYTLTVTRDTPPTPTISTSPTQQTIYAGQTVTFTASGAGSGVWAWTGASGSGNTATATFSSAGTYNVSAYQQQDNYYAQSPAASVTITVVPALTLSANPSSASVNQSITFTAANGAGTGGWVWGGDGAALSGSSASKSFPSSGTYNVTVSRQGDGTVAPSNTASVSVVVNNPYVLTVVNGSGGGSYNPGTVVPIAAYSYSGWTFQGWGQSGPGSIANPSATNTTFTMAAGNATVGANFSNNPPSQPGTPQVSNITTTRASLTWAASTDTDGIVGYVISYDGATTNLSASGTTSFDIPFRTFAPNSTHTVRVAAVDGYDGKLGPWSPTVSFTTTADTTAPGVPNPRASAVSVTTFNLMWDIPWDEVGVTQYRVYQTVGGTTTLLGTTSNQNYQMTGLSMDTSYTYSVSACDNAGNWSAQSAPVTVTTSSPVLLGLHAAGYGLSSGQSLTLTSYEGAYSTTAGYDAQVSTAPGAGASSWTALHQYRGFAPGIDNVLTLAGGSARELRFEVPAGYTLLVSINGSEVPYTNTATIDMTNVPGGSLTFSLMPNDGTTALDAGYSIDPEVSIKNVVWAMSLGRTPDGLTLGALSLRKTDIVGDPIAKDTLKITEQGQGNWISQYSDSLLGCYWGAARRVIATPSCVIFLDDRSVTAPTGKANYFEVRVYDPATIVTWNGAAYEFKKNGTAIAPFARYGFSNDAGNNNVINITKNVGQAEQLTWSLTKTVDSTTQTTWTLQRANNRKLKLKSVASGNPVDTTTDEVTLSDAGDVVAQKFTKQYKKMPWSSWELVSEQDDPSGYNLTTTYAYGQTAGQASYGKVTSVTKPDGTYTAYDYYSDDANFGNLAHTYSRWLDVTSTASTANATNAQTVTLTYKPVHGYMCDALDTTTTTVPSGGAGVMIAKSVRNPDFTSTTFNGHKVRKETIQTYTNASSYLTTTRLSYHPDETANDIENQLISETSPTGTKVSTIYYKAAFTDNGDSNTTVFKTNANSALNTQWGEYKFNGFSTAVTGSALVNTWDGQPIDPIYLVPNRSTIELTVMDKGNPAYKVNYVFTGASSGVPSFEFLSEEKFIVSTSTNGSGVTTTTKTHSTHNGAVTVQTFTDGRLMSEVGNDGQEVDYTYDATSLLVSKKLKGVAASGNYAAQADLYTYYTYDAASRKISDKTSTSTDPNAAGATITYHYDTAGRLDQQTDPTGLTTTISYDLGNHATTSTVPGGATKIVTTYADGTPKSVSGTAVVGSYANLVVNGDGTISRTGYTLRSSDVANPTAAPRWSKSTTDWLGRTTREETPAIGGTIAKIYNYNGKGELTSVETRDASSNVRLLADTYTEYNAYEMPYRSGQDLDSTAGLQTASALDRVSETDAVFQKDGSNVWWLVKTSSVYNQAGSGTAVTTATTKERQNGFAAAGTNVQSQTVAIDIFGNQTDSKVVVDRANFLTTDTTTLPNSSAPDVSVTRNGLLVSRTSAANLTVTFAYDAYRRLTCTSDPRVDGSTLAKDLGARTGYYDQTAPVGARWQKAWDKDTAGFQTSYSYSITTGRLSAVQAPPLPNQPGKFTYYDYSRRGELIRTWGGKTYPVEYAYDDYGQKYAMRTFRNSQDFTTSTWPLTDDPDPLAPIPRPWTTGDRTVWGYDAATGALLSKLDATNHSVTYTYTQLGQVKTKTLARGDTITYKYYREDAGDPLTGELKSEDFSNTTSTNPDVSYTYNRAGKPASITDAIGTRSFAYDPTFLTLTSETLPGAFNSSGNARLLTEKYDTTGTGTKGRGIGFSLGTAGNTTADYNVTYGYDTYGRGGTVTSAGTTFTYGYTPGSNLIASITDGANYTQTKTWNPNRDLLASIETKMSTASKAKFQYGVDEWGRRTSLIRSGEVYSRYINQGLVNTWGYDDRSQVTSAQTYYGTSLSDLSYPVEGRSFGFSYDNIGNRLTSSVDGRTTSYNNNALNQITDRVTPSGVDVSGFAPTGSTVSVSAIGNIAGNTTTTANWPAQTVDRQGDYYHTTVAASNSASATYGNVTVTSTAPSTSTTRKVFVPKNTLTTSEQWQYDADGNILRDDQWTYTWTDENRLASMETRSDLISTNIIPAADARHIDFTYDYLGRRAEKIVRGGWNGSTYATVISDTRFIYHGWNLVGEFAVGSASLTRSYTWGLDLSGTLAADGGTGGLLMTQDGATQYVYAYDGNGNVSAVMNRSSGSTVAEYEYGAFGEVLRASNTYAQTNPFRFSTQYVDNETGYSYYGNRYYNPQIGRFLGRDKIEETGGLNLYAFCGNNAVNTWDNLGNDPGYDRNKPKEQMSAQEQKYWADQDWAYASHFWAPALGQAGVFTGNPHGDIVEGVYDWSGCDELKAHAAAATAATLAKINAGLNAATNVIMGAVASATTAAITNGISAAFGADADAFSKSYASSQSSQQNAFAASVASANEAATLAQVATGAAEAQQAAATNALVDKVNAATAAAATTTQSTQGGSASTVTNSASAEPVVSPTGNSASVTPAPNSAGSLTLGDKVRILMGVASTVSPGNPVPGMIDKGVAVGQMTGSAFTGINAAINPVFGVLEGGYENVTGLSLNPDTPQATLTFGQRVLSGISAELNLAGTVGVGTLGADLLAPSLTPANSLLGADIGWKGGEITFTVPGKATPDLRINPTGDWSSTNPNAQLPHYHSRPGIGWHRPWEGPE